MMCESAILDSPGPYLDSIDDEITEKLSMTRSSFVIPLSASKPSALLTQTENLAAFVARNQDINVVDLARTLGTRRSRLSERGYMLAGQKTLLDDLHAERLMQGVAGRNYSTHPFAFVFTGKCYTLPNYWSFTWLKATPKIHVLTRCYRRPRSAMASDGQRVDSRISILSKKHRRP